MYLFVKLLGIKISRVIIPVVPPVGEIKYYRFFVRSVPLFRSLMLTPMRSCVLFHYYESWFDKKSWEMSSDKRRIVVGAFGKIYMGVVVGENEGEQKSEQAVCVKTVTG